MSVVRVHALVAVGLVLGGCLADEPPVEGPAVNEALSDVLPTMDKLVFSTDGEAGTVVDDLLGTTTTTTRPLTVPAGTAALRLALDVRPALEQAAPNDQASVRLLGPDDAEVLAVPATTEAVKVVHVVDDPPTGELTLVVESRGRWNVGLQTVAVPVGYTPGLEVSISTPEAEAVEHRFYPNRLRAEAGVPTRITLYDYDPHAGVENLQHNLVIPGLGVATEERTTWGEVRVVDLTPMAAGSYDYYCEYHEEALRGTLVVT